MANEWLETSINFDINGKDSENKPGLNIALFATNSENWTL